MNIRLIFGLFSLTITLQLLSASDAFAVKIRCWLFCSEQTAIQNDYTAARDFCRNYAQLRFETDTANTETEEQNRVSKMVSLFSGCMAEKGWSVPDGKPAGQTASTTPAAPTAPAASSAINSSSNQEAAIIAAKNAENEAKREARRKQAFLARTSECAFARHAAAYSSASAALAKACDIECAEKLKLASTKEHPAACPAD